MNKVEYEEDDPLEEIVDKTAWNGLAELDAAMNEAGAGDTHIHDSLDVESTDGYGTYIGLNNPHSDFEEVASNLTKRLCCDKRLVTVLPSHA